MDHIAALQREHATYVAQSRPDRAAAVEAELERLGAAPAAAAVDPTSAEVAADIRRPRPRSRKK